MLGVVFYIYMCICMWIAKGSGTVEVCARFGGFCIIGYSSLVGLVWNRVKWGGYGRVSEFTVHLHTHTDVQTHTHTQMCIQVETYVHLQMYNISQAQKNTVHITHNYELYAVKNHLLLDKDLFSSVSKHEQNQKLKLFHFWFTLCGVSETPGISCAEHWTHIKHNNLL